MARLRISEIDGTVFDVVVVGAGIAGCSAARELVARGFTVLVVDQGDFASGATGRSDRFLACGLEHLRAERSLFNVLLNPREFLRDCQTAKASMQGRSEMVKAHPDRVRPINFCIPIYEDGPLKWSHVKASFFTLWSLSPKDLPLDAQLLAPRDAAQRPVLSWLRNPTSLKGVVVYREYQLDWPERVALDTLLHAQRGGAGVRNYSQVTAIERRPDGVYALTVTDTLGDGSATVQARMVVNTAGAWADRVNRLAKPDIAPRLLPTKGSFIAVQLARDCREWGVALRARNGSPLLCVPWRGLHFFGPAESVYSGDMNDVRVTEDEIAALLEEANRALPGLDIRRQTVRHTWAGVWPLGLSPQAESQASRRPNVEVLDSAGLPNVLMVTASSFVTHSWTTARVVDEVRRRVVPSREKPEMRVPPGQTEQRKGRHISDGQVSISVGTLKHVAEHEGAATLNDLLFRRTGLGWDTSMGYGLAEPTAETVAELMGWSPGQAKLLAREYQQFVKHVHHVDAVAEAAVRK